VIEVCGGGVDGEPDGNVLARLDGLFLGSQDLVYLKIIKIVVTYSNNPENQIRTPKV